MRGPYHPCRMQRTGADSGGRRNPLRSWRAGGIRAGLAGALLALGGLSGVGLRGENIKQEITKLVAADAKRAAADVTKSQPAPKTPPKTAVANSPAAPADSSVKLPKVVVKTNRLPNRTRIAKTVVELRRTVAKIDRQISEADRDATPSRLDRTLNGPRWSLAGTETAGARANAEADRAETLELERFVAASALARCIALRDGKTLSKEDQAALARDLQTLASLKLMKW